MPTTSWISGARVLAAACLLVGLDAYAQTPTVLLDAVHTVAAPTVAVPIEQTINITAKGTYQVTLTDIGAQLTPAAPVTSVALAISSGSGLVNVTAVGNATTRNNTQLVGTGSVTFTAATTGNYVFHLTGAPSSNPASGQINVAVTPTASGGGATTDPTGFNGVLQLPPSNVQHNVGVLNGSFQVQNSGNYVVTLTDMQLPVALTTLQLYIATPSGTIVTPTTFGTSAGNPTATATVALQTGVNYGIFAGGQAGGSVNAGLYGVNVSPSGGGAAVYTNTIPVGSVVSLGSPALSASNYTVSLTDLTYPAALAQLGVAVTLNGQLVTQLAATGTSAPFTATANPYQVYSVGVASGNQGSYTVSVQPAGGTPILSAARAVTDPATGVFAYSFDTTTVGSEVYNFDLADFGYPAAFSSLKGVAIQSGAQLGTVDSSGTTSGTQAITPAAGAVTLLVFAHPVAPTGGGNAAGLFGLDLIANGAGAPQFETSQGVGQLFSVQKVTVSEGGPYQAVVADLGFPGNFATLGVVVTRGTSKIGSIFGGGTLPFNAIGGDYLVNFVAQPDTTDQAGTYSIVVEQAPATATATLQVSPTTVAPGGTVSLKWSSSNVSSCTGTSSPAGAWPGTIGTGGSTTSAALNATTTFTYTCVGTDGTNPSQSVTVTVTSNSGGGGGHGGGGSIGADVIAALFGLFVLRGLSRRTYRC